MSSATKQLKTSYIVSPIYDNVLFIFCPLLALGLGWVLSQLADFDQPITALAGYEGSAIGFALGALIFAHLGIVVVRGYGNADVRRAHPIRMWLIPPLLFFAFYSSLWVLVIFSVLATWWDVYHSGMQTFGLGRIYDRKIGNDPLLGRRADHCINLLLYAGPILAGATLMDHVNDFGEFDVVEALFFTNIPVYVESNSSILAVAILCIAIPAIICYVYYYYLLAQRGYKVSPQKVILMVATAVTSLLAWGFNSFGEAFLIMNVFHAVQYFALIWAVEKKTIFSTFRMPENRWGTAGALVLFIGLALLFGAWVEAGQYESRAIISFVLLVSILHFWFDGFIWGVSKPKAKVTG